MQQGILLRQAAAWAWSYPPYAKAMLHSSASLHEQVAAKPNVTVATLVQPDASHQDPGQVLVGLQHGTTCGTHHTNFA